MKRQLGLPRSWWFEWAINILLAYLSRRLEHQAYQHGLGRHTRQEANDIAKKSFKALSDFLGDKPYLMGDKPTVTDCSAFGFLTPCVISPFSKRAEELGEEFPNLKAYAERMVAEFYPEWRVSSTTENPTKKVL